MIDLRERLGDEADLCRNEGADDIANLLDEARWRIEALYDALDYVMSAHGEQLTDAFDQAERVLAKTRGAA